MSVSFFSDDRSSLSGAAPARDAASVAPETASAPRNPRRLVLDMMCLLEIN